MTKALRSLTLVLVGLLVLSFTIISAQDEDTSGFPEDLSGFIVQPALSGEFAANDDGTFTLSLVSATEFNAWIVSAPDLFTANHSLAEFAGDWSFDEEISADALLQLDELTVSLTLAAPVYYLVDGTFSYTVTINEIVGGTDSKGGPSLPETFDGATLIIQLNADFANSYRAARMARLAETRVEGQGCAPFPSPC